MRLLSIATLVCLLFFSPELFGQVQSFCQTPANYPNPITNVKKSKRSGDEVLTIRIFVHIIRKTDGTGGQSDEDVNEALNLLLGDFEPHGITFCLAGIEEVNNSTHYYSSNFTNLIAINPHDDALDLYLLDDDDANYVGGRANGIPGNALVLGGNLFSTDLVRSHVLSHETGHCLGLYHTHHGTFNEGCPETGCCAELVDGSNCSTCGDYVCDTPADPHIQFTNVDVDCNWTGSGTDANGDDYEPDTRNIMAYVEPRCMEYFSTEQGERMVTTIENSQILQNITIEETIVLNSETINSGETRIYNAHNTIETSNFTVNSGANVSLNAGNEITLGPGFSVGIDSEFSAQKGLQCNSIETSTKKSAKITTINSTLRP